MKIFFDYRIFYHQFNGGISRYILNLSKEFLLLNKENFLVAPIHINVMLDYYSKNFINYKGIYIKKKKFFTNKFMNLVNYALTNYYTYKLRPSVYHQTYYGGFPRAKNIIKVVTVHDLIHEKYYMDYGLLISDRPKKKSIEQSDKIICVSSNTKKDLQEYYNVDDKKIFVINHGHEHLINLIDASKKINRENFILYVGGRDKYKNFKSFIEAYSSSSILKKETKIVCFGGGNFKNSEIELFIKKKIYNNITYVEGNDLDLAILYRKALMLIYPSLYEGFGFPIVEAMSLGCPVVVSNSESLKETAGSTGIYFDPMNTEDLADKLEKVIMQGVDIKRIHQGYEHLKKFSWKSCAINTIKAYEY